HLRCLHSFPTRRSSDLVMSSQVFEYLDDVASSLSEMLRVLRPGGRVLIHDTDWGALLWHTSDPERMARMLETWDRHLADPHLPRSEEHTSELQSPDHLV